MLQDLHRLAPADAAATEAHRHAYNCAFCELDLDWHWDEHTFGWVQRAGLRAWVEVERPHLLRAYDLDFLVDAIEREKARCHEHHVRLNAAPHSQSSPRSAA